MREIIGVSIWRAKYSRIGRRVERPLSVTRGEHAAIAFVEKAKRAFESRGHRVEGGGDEECASDWCFYFPFPGCPLCRHLLPSFGTAVPLYEA